MTGDLEAALTELELFIDYLERQGRTLTSDSVEEARGFVYAVRVQPRVWTNPAAYREALEDTGQVYNRLARLAAEVEAYRAASKPRMQA